MDFHSVFSTLRSLLAGNWLRLNNQPRRSRGKNGLRFALETLEERTLLTNFLVTTANDDSTADAVLSLREAIDAANANSGADTITFSSSLSGQRLFLTQGELVISDPVTITGLGATNTVLDALTSSRVLYLTNSAGDVTLDGVTVTAGRTDSSNYSGAGIYSASFGTLTLTNSTVTANATTGTFSQGAGIFSFAGPVVLVNSTISGNSTSGGFSPGGGIATNSGSITVVNSTISSNATSGPNSGGGGIATYSGNLKLTNSTVTANLTTGTNSAGGGMFSGGTGSSQTSTITINNSIVAVNTASSSTSSDISKNTGVSALIVNSSLIGVNSGTGLTAAPLGSPDVNGNLIGTTSAPIDPKLGPLAINGGTTKTHALLSTSPAIDAGNNSLAVTPAGAALTLDQVGQIRIFHSLVDMGSYELQSVPAVPTVSFSTSSQNVGEGAGVVTITVNLSAATSQTVTVPFTVGGTASNPADYSISSSPLVIPANTTSGTIQITIVNDSNFEGNETVVVTLGTPTNATLGSTTVETVTITDNDNGAPTNITLSANSVTENVANAVVGTLTATDPNPGDTVTFSIQSGGQGSQFSLVGSQLRVGSSGLNFEALSGGVASVTIRATDSSGLFFDKILNINVADVNEAPSIPTGLDFSVTESSTVGTAVGTVVGSDPDTTAPNKTLTYSIVGGNTNNAFAINASTGQITVATQSAVNGSTPVFTLQVKVADGGSPSLSSTQNVTVNVADANGAPSIPSGQIFTTSENRSLGAVVGTVTANDPDSTAPNNTLTYSIASGNTGNAFAINSATGQITVNTPTVINFESIQQFNLQITVTDGGSPALSATNSVKINVSDINETPSISSGQSFGVGQNAPVGTVVGTVAATDPDGAAPNNTLFYTIVGGNLNNAFSMNSATGQITVLTPAALNPAIVPQFSLQVRVTDGGSPSLSTTQTVTINVSAAPNQAPTILGNQSFTINENSNANTVVGTVVASDPDTTAPNKTLTYSITGGNTNSAFAINSSTGQLTVNNGTALNFEATQQFVLQVQVADGGSPSLTATGSVTINIADVNESPTILEGQNFSVAEHAPNATTVGLVVATDPDTTAPNKTLTYSILSGNTNNAFSINATTGQISAANSAALNLATAPSFSLSVRVTDGGTPSLSSTQTVTISLIDANDPPTIQAGQVFTITDSAAANSLVGTVQASDPDTSPPNNTLTFSISGGNTGTAFAINGKTGQITVSNSSALNFLTTPQYVLQVRVADGGSPSLSTTQSVIINVNETNHAPTIQPGQSFSITENPAVNAVLGTIIASDTDITSPNNTLTFSIIGGNTNNAFTINSVTGQITVANPAGVNFEVSPSFALQVRARDGGTPSLTATQTVTITVNDINESPTIPAGQVLSVNENAATTTVVGTASATDPDLSGPNSTRTFSISGGNTNNAFAINASTGQITVNNSAALTFANGSFFTLAVHVADGGSPSLSATQNVRVNLIDVNAAPSIAAGQTFTIAENLGSNTTVGTVLATDPDATAPNSTLAYSIIGGNTNNAFTINSATGQLTVNNSSALNFEVTAQFALQIQVLDGGSPSLSATQLVTVNLSDLNEAPSIAAGQSFSVPEQSAINTIVGTILATDPDTTAPNHILNYSIIGGNINNGFAINPSTGQISVTNSAALNPGTTPQFMLTVQVADGGSPSLSTTQGVIVNVIDVNEAPSIPSGQILSVVENAGNMSSIGTVVASDPDATTPNQTLTYSILNGNLNNAFSINPTTGQVTVANSTAMNFETTPLFVLQIQVADGGAPSLTATNNVIVNVVDANETPEILTGQSFSIVENSTFNTSVGTIVASDPDTTSPDNTLLYSIAGGNTGNAFAINSMTGEVTVNNASAIDFETNPLFTLQISVTDGGGLSAVPQSVTIHVTNVNEAPVIATGQVFSVIEHAVANTIVNTVIATDPDSTAPENTLNYTIMSGNDNNAFIIDTASGQIRVGNSAALTFANGSSYALQIGVTDDGTPALTDVQTVTINLIDVNEAPVITAGQSFAIFETPNNGLFVGTALASDADPTVPNNSLTYSIIGGNPGNAFAIDPVTGQLTVSNPNAINFEAIPQFTLQVQVTDGGQPALSAIQNVVITINDANEAPSIIANQSFTLPEHSAINTDVGLVAAVDPDTNAPNNTLTYSLVDGNTNNAFAIDPTTGQITVSSTSALDFDTTPQFALQVQVTDGGGLSDTQTVVVNLTDVDDTPVVENPGDAPIYTHRQNDSVVVFPNIVVTDLTSSTDLGQIIISLPIPPGRRNFDQIGINSAAALGVVTDTTVGGRRQISIQLNEGVTTTDVQNFLREVTFSTKRRGLRLTHRDFQIHVVDRDNQSSNVVTQDIVVQRRSRR